ncbi:MAG: hypothetical protein P8J32_09060 [bacterium]|nr:hypothetical protein [bacterium]
MQEQVQNEQFHSDVDRIFESYLSTEPTPKIMVRNTKTDQVMEQSAKMNYSKIFFDSDLNIYKIDNAGTLVKVETSDFDAVVVKSL